MEINLADWLQKILEEKGWSQAELARKSGVSPAQITRVLSGERGLREQSVVAIAKAVNLPPEEVFRATGLLPPTREKDPADNELSYLFGLLEEDDRQQVLDYVRYVVDKAESRKR